MGAGAAAVAAGLDSSVRTVRYSLVTAKLRQPARLLIISDLHSTIYGQGQSMLGGAARALAPDFALFPGDTDDGVRSALPAMAAVRQVAAVCPVFLTLGNHELIRRSPGAETRAYERAGAVVLNSESVTAATRAGEMIRIAGVPDSYCLRSTRRFYTADVAKASRQVDGSLFSVLAAHRPEFPELYFKYPYDLAVCGHAHGGQWRIPGVVNGLFAPGQGLLPKYAGGLYRFGGGAMAVSRGMAIGNTPLPRLYNPPEMVVVDLVPRHG